MLIIYSRILLVYLHINQVGKLNAVILEFPCIQSSGYDFRLHQSEDLVWCLSSLWAKVVACEIPILLVQFYRSNRALEVTVQTNPWPLDCWNNVTTSCFPRVLNVAEEAVFWTVYSRSLPGGTAWICPSSPSIHSCNFINT